MWWSLSSVQNIYQAYGLSWASFESGPIEDLFSNANSANIGCAQSQPGLTLPGTFDHSIIDANLWPAQTLPQHHSTTIQTLVNTKYR